MPVCTPTQCWLLHTARGLFIGNCLTNFPLYYLPPFRGMLEGDGANTKFPCSISWMTRKGIARLSTLVLWNMGWAFMLFAFLLDEGEWAWAKLAFMLQMFVTGFVTVVLTPMKGPDVALGRRDALHCYSAMIYVADHFLANQLVLDVPMHSFYGCCFVVTSLLCGICQYLRAEDDKAARILYARLVMIFKRGNVSLGGFTFLLEVGFMLFENLLFFVFLVGMTSGLRTVAS